VNWLDRESYLPVLPPLTNAPGCRDAEVLADVLEQFDVTHAKRYVRGHDPSNPGATYCNIFVWDATSALECEIPHWFNPISGEKRPVAGGSEMDKWGKDHDLGVWLVKFGNIHGWRKVEPVEAAARADAGFPVVIDYSPGPGREGHVAMLMADGLIAQAGAHNIFKGSFGFGFGALPVTFWTHD
jgi:hypothetical protein